MLKIGSLLDGKYKILNEIGRGGMSVVYMALNEKANKTWAVKEIRKDGKMDFNVVKQGLVAEIETLKKLKHHNLPSIVDVIEDKDSFIIVMDYIEGNSLDRALIENGPQSQDDVINWAIQLCDVLGYLHSCDPPIIYRDMKPANIMLKPDGSIALIDFGTAKTYEIDLGETTGIGTIGYAAPEQYLGSGLGRTDARTDIYCLGITLYHLLTGIDPCKNVISDRSIRAVNPSFSHGLDEIIIKCTQPNPNDRYQSCAELLYALEHHNEMGEIYNKKLKKKLGIFIAPVALSLIMAVASIFLGVSADGKKKNDYDNIIKSIYSLPDHESRREQLKKAVKMSPEREDAYLTMLEVVLEEETSNEGAYMISADESGFLNWCLTDTEMNYLDVLKEENPDGHLAVCKEMGFKLWYNYKSENGGYDVARGWFRRIADVDDVAEMFSNIAESREKIKQLRGRNNPNSETLYIECWTTLNDMFILSETLTDKSYKKVALNEIADCISMYVTGFLTETEEITKEDLLGLLAKVKQEAMSKFATDDELLAKIDEAEARVGMVVVE